MSQKRVRAILGTSLTVLALSLAGCRGGGSAVSLEPGKQRIVRVADLAREYQTATKKKPKSIEEIKNWAVKEGKASEDDFISPRDHEPYGIASGMMGLLIYEQTGKNGKVYMYSTGAVREVNPAEVSRMRELESQRRGGPPR